MTKDKTMIPDNTLAEVREALSEIIEATQRKGFVTVAHIAATKGAQALTKLDAFIAAQGWQPIETAPRDGAEILAWSDEGNPHQVYWKTWENWKWLPEFKPYWACRWNADYRQHDFNFTHWMPLPKPPKMGDGGMKEPEIIINGVKCTDAMSMTIRVAISSFQVDLQHQGLGDDPIGKKMVDLYQDRIFEVHKLMFINDHAHDE